LPNENRLGLLLGAGASFELGMPLVRHLTAEFKGFFTPTHIRELNLGWKRQGGGFDDRVIEETIDVLTRRDLNYEAILGFLQTQHRRLGQTQHLARQYYDMYQRMVEIVYFLLLHRQVHNLTYFRRGFPPYEGLLELVNVSEPVWVFSLNHDLMLELLAVHLGVPVRDGFWPNQTLLIPNVSRNGTTGKALTAEVITEDNLAKGHLHLFRRGESGVNLIKLHGALHIFAFRDGLDLCRLKPLGQDLGSPLRALHVANEELGYWANDERVRVVNEITYTDPSGEMQFLRRSLLAGAHKFDTRFDQTLPMRMLEVFRSHLNDVHQLYVVGYSYEDAHVNRVLREWLQLVDERRMIIVDPRRGSLPVHFAHVAPQVSLRQQTAGEFFAGLRREPLSRMQLIEQQVRRCLRRRLERRAAKKW